MRPNSDAGLCLRAACHGPAVRTGLLTLLLTSVGCLQRPVDNPNILVISMSLRLSPIADFSFLRDVARVRPAAN